MTSQQGSTVYLAVTLPTGIAPGDLAGIQRALADAARRSSEGGAPVRFVHGMYLPAHQSLLCAFSAPDERTVHAAARLTGLPFTPIDAATASRLTSKSAERPDTHRMTLE